MRKISKSERIKEIESEIKSQEIYQDCIKPILELILASVICAIIVYKCCVDCGFNAFKGLLLGVCFPWGFIPVHKIFMRIYEYVEPFYKYFALLTLGISAIFIFLLELFISGCVGIVALPITITQFILEIKRISKKDYSNDAKYKYKLENPSKNLDLQDVMEDLIDENAIHFEDEYYCEQCCKRIKKEDFKHYNCMCKQCFEKINTSKDLGDL